MPQGPFNPALPPGALADMLVKTYSPGGMPAAPAGVDPAALMAAKMMAANVGGGQIGVDPRSGLPYGSSSIQGEQAGTYVDPSTSAINAADLAAAAGQGRRAPAPAAGMPKREDFPSGIAGQGQFNQAVLAWRAKAGA